MEIDIKNDLEIVTIWLTNAEKRDEKIQKRLKQIYESFKVTGYKVAVFYSGAENLADVTSDLICYNRKRIAEKEVEQSRKNDLVMEM